MQYRRSNYDVTDQVKLTDPVCVYEEIRSILSEFCSDSSFIALHQAFHDMEDMYRGRMEGYLACDVPYHDMQHVMDVTLASARLLSGHEKEQSKSDRLGPDRLILGVILALFHDCGYIRKEGDEESTNGAIFSSILPLRNPISSFLSVVTDLIKTILLYLPGFLLLISFRPSAQAKNVLPVPGRPEAMVIILSLIDLINFFWLRRTP